MSQATDPAGAPVPPPGGAFPGVDGPALSTGDDAPNRIAAAMRRISSVVVGQPVSDGDLAETAARLTAVADRLQAATEPVRVTRQKPFPAGHPQDFFPTSPMTGFANPVAPPVEVWTVEGEDGGREIRGRATFGFQYEGPPTCVHGGAIAELFDELLGLTCLVVNQAGMTGTLTIRYRRPTPLMAPLDLAGRFVRRERRKIFAWGGIFSEGELTAEADGVFIEVPTDRMLDIVSGNAHGTDGPLVDADWQRKIVQQRAAANDDPSR